jgi:hypothetical protein
MRPHPSSSRCIWSRSRAQPPSDPGPAQGPRRSRRRPATPQADGSIGARPAPAARRARDRCATRRNTPKTDGGNHERERRGPADDRVQPRPRSAEQPLLEREDDSATGGRRFADRRAER